LPQNTPPSANRIADYVLLNDTRFRAFGRPAAEGFDITESDSGT
jgi:hypothetical protein